MGGKQGEKGLNFVETAKSEKPPSFPLRKRAVFGIMPRIGKEGIAMLTVLSLTLDSLSISILC